MTKLVLSCLLFCFGLACHSSTEKEDNGQLPSPSPQSSKAQAPQTSSAQQSSSASHEKLSPADVSRLCERLDEIKRVPIKGDRGLDATFDAFMDAGDDIIPCLIERVIDKKKITGPNPLAPGWAGIQVTLGDVAFFVLLYSKEATTDEFLPADLKEDYKLEGAYTYYKYVKNPGNRKNIQAKLRERYKDLIH